MKNFYCICGTVYEQKEYDDYVILICPDCGKSDKIDRQQKIINLTINKDIHKKNKMTKY